MGKEAALPKNIRQIGDIQGKEKICIEDYVMTYIRKKEQQSEKGCLGVFLGETQETEDAVYVFIRGILEIPGELPEEEVAKYLQEEGEKYFSGWEIQGWCVIGAYQAGRLQQLAPQMPRNARVIYHLQEQEETVYWMEGDRYRRIRGYFVFYEQNRKMQEYLSTAFRNDSVEGEGASDKAIRTFREKVKEKGERKSRSMLKLAGSFFVITVLVIGAVVVNRVEEIRTVQKLVTGDQMVSDSTVQREGESVSSGGNLLSNTEPVSESEMKTESESTMKESLSQITDGVSGSSSVWAENSSGGNAGEETAESLAATEEALAGSDAFWEDSE